MQSSLKRILIGASFFGLTLICAVIGYIMAGWNLLDAIYMVVITVFGVGYGEVLPVNTPHLKIFTMLVIIAGTSSAVYIVGSFIQMITEGEINRALGARRMTREIETLSQHVIICGFGRMGQILARRLADDRHPFVVIDNNHDRTTQAESMGYLVRLGSATDEDILQAAGITRARCLATVLPDDAINIFITLTAFYRKEIAPRRSQPGGAPSGDQCSPDCRYDYPSGGLGVSRSRRWPHHAQRTPRPD
jgi:voltage-gated potassium channel